MWQSPQCAASAAAGQQDRQQDQRGHLPQLTAQRAASAGRDLTQRAHAIPTE